MKIFCCQLDIVWEAKRANQAKVASLLSAGGVPQGSLVLLPEMFSTGYSMNVAAIAEGESRETETFLANTAREFGLCLLGGVVNAAPDGRGRNEAVVFSPEGREIARYGKRQPFSLGGESQHYVAGCETVTFQWQNFVVSPFICYDLRFPELFRAAALRGAQLLVVIANWPDVRLRHWVKLLQARAIENQAYVAGVNRCGSDPKHSYSAGRSLIIDPHGETLVEADGREGLISASLDLPALLDYRSDFPFLADLRRDALKWGD